MAIDNLEKEQKEFVILRRYRDLPEAVVSKAFWILMALNGFFTDENLIRMDWFWSGLLGGSNCGSSSRTLTKPRI